MVSAVRMPSDRDLQRCFLDSYSLLRPMLLAAPAPGFHLVAADPFGAILSTHLPIEAGRSHHHVIGRHSDCHLRLAHDPALSLRHLLVSAWLDEDGGPTLRLLDLGGEVPLRLEDGSRCTGLRADGSVLIGLGSYCLFFLYDDGQAWPTDPQEAWDSLGDRATAKRRSEQRDGNWAALVRPRLRVVAPPGNEESTGLSATGTVLVRLEGTASLRDLSSSGEGAIGFLRLPQDRFVRLTPADLTRGVLVGRYDRCELTQGFDEDRTVSRVHLCLACDPTGLWAIDIASRNGTWDGEERVAALRLGQRADLSLGNAALVWEMNRT